MTFMSYEELVNKARQEKDEFFKHSKHSPLTPAQQRSFQGLNYFEPDINYRFEVELQEYQNQQEVVIQTSKGDSQKYVRYGFIEFELEGKTNILSVYTQKGSKYFFVPFKDKTTGKETYGAGRYIEIDHLEKNKYILDFNFAYNPYCAYNDNWTCPLTPFENKLDVSIKAGEKKFH